LLCKGKLRLGFGRGLARREFAAFRGTMDESRGRFDEAAPMIVNALKTGFIEGNGPHYPQPRIEIRPRPKYDFSGRIYAVASSEDSVAEAARIGAHMVMFCDRPWPMKLAAIERNRDLHQQFHGRPAPALMITDFCMCGADPAKTEENARKYMGKFVESNFHHYEFFSEHFATVKGYDAYTQRVEMARKGGIEAAIANFMQAVLWGTPDRILRTLESRRSIVGDFELNVAFRYGGVPYAIAEQSLTLFAKEVLPVLHSWNTPAAVQAAE
jgi:alkanesulfonate monooxygenase SsuD/methylene tetrahydromethanopterin reductase-like flavin-dependent oxidoreductase (luciferase family)